MGFRTGARRLTVFLAVLTAVWVLFWILSGGIPPPEGHEGEVLLIVGGPIVLAWSLTLGLAWVIHGFLSDSADVVVEVVHRD